MIDRIPVHLDHVALHLIKQWCKQSWPPQCRPFVGLSVVHQQTVQAINRCIGAQVKAVHVDMVTRLGFVKDEIWDATKAKGCKLLLVAVWLQDLANFNDS